MQWIGYRRPRPRVVSDEPVEGEDIARQLEHMVGDPVFRKSENLRNILTFLAQEAVLHPGVNHKEHEIATSALGRGEDFDPRFDSTVRVHTARLRSKLAAYYSGNGRRDPVVFDIPKGAYQLEARLAAPLPEEPAATEGARLPSRQVLVWLACVGWLVALGAAGVAVHFRLRSSERELTPALKTFWSEFFQTDVDTALVFSPPRMTGSSTNGLHFVQNQTVSPDQLVESYAGTGEVYGIGALAGLFGSYRGPVRIKRGRLLTWDDARQENLIFVGGPAVNLQLGELPQLQRFTFTRATGGPFQGESAICDVFAKQSSPICFGHSPRPYSFDHAVIALMHRSPKRAMLLLAGTTTVGTQAAVDFVVREETVHELLGALKASSTGQLPGFEALIEVKASDGVPVQSRILAVHLRR